MAMKYRKARRLRRNPTADDVAEGDRLAKLPPIHVSRASAFYAGLNTRISGLLKNGTRADVVEKLGIPDRRLRRIQNGATVHPEEVLRLAQGFRIPIDWLFDDRLEEGRYRQAAAGLALVQLALRAAQQAGTVVGMKDEIEQAEQAIDELVETLTAACPFCATDHLCHHTFFPRTST